MTRTTAMKKIILAAVSAMALAAAPSAFAQTARAGTPPPVPPNQQQPSATGTATTPTVPVPDSVIMQARWQQDGIYGHLERPRSEGQIQEVWDDAGHDAGIYKTDACADCTYKVQAREWMVTVIELPRGEVIENVDIGDQKGFQVSQRGPSRLAVRPVGHGYDTNVLIYGKSGAIYPVYLRAIGFNAVDVADMVMRIEGTVHLPDDSMAVSGIASDDKGKAGKAPLNGLPAVFAGATPTATPLPDFVENAPFDPSKLRGWGQYRLSGNDDTMEPDTVYRDDRFTYIKYGERKWTQTELPTAFVVVDGIDELVNTRVMGDTYVIESTRPKITLKSGESYLCITYTGGDA